jgi:hypothetical protein
VQSVVVSLLSLSMQYFTVLWEANYKGKSLVRVFLDRFRSVGQPILVTVDVQPNIEDDIERSESESSQLNNN